MYDAFHRSQLAVELAAAIADGPWSATEVAERAAGCLDRRPGWMSALAMRVVAVHRAAPATPWPLVTVIEVFLGEHEAAPADADPPVIIRLATRVGSPPALHHDWPIVAIETVGELAQRLELSGGQLAWLADVRGLERTVAVEQLRNYRYRLLGRPSGLPRVIEAPKARLKEIQRRMLREILDQIPPHDAAHGFTPGRSVVGHAAVHAGRPVVLRFDLADFFASVTAGRVYGIFRAAGYRPAVAHVLTGLSTNTVPAAVWLRIPRAAEPWLIGAHFGLGRRLATPHLPQGAPTSPALANLAAFRLDRRLAGLAASSELRYSRYADDLAFSGRSMSRGRIGRFGELVATIVADEGFALQPAKSSVRVSASRQTVCGVVVNVRPNVTRREYDELKAILHHAAPRPPGSGPRDAGLEARLRGRIAWVAQLHPERGAKLRRRLAEIDWGPAAGEVRADE